MASRKSSEIWLHFTEYEINRAKCNYCKASLSFSGGSTGNLSRHLKSKHPLLPRSLQRQTVVHILEEQPLACPQPSNSSQPSTSSEPATSSLITTSPQPSTSLQARLQQQSISRFIRKPPPSSKVQQIDRLVLKAVAQGNHSLRFVEEPAIRELIHEVSYCPGYQLPTRKTLSKTLLESVYMEVLETVKTNIRSSVAVCLTTDSWTSRTNTSYLAITAHYIAEDLQLKSYLIACDEFSERHTAENLSTFIKKTMIEFEIASKVTAIVSDNAANIVAAIRQGNWRNVGCFAHSLNLVVQAALKEVEDTVAKVRKIVEYFRRSSQGLNKLFETQKQMGIPEIKLKQDVATRWNSTYLMLERIVATKDAVTSTLSLKRPDLLLTPQEWGYITEIIPILKPFWEVTVEVCGEKNVTLSKVTVICNILEGFISKCSSTDSKISAMISKIKCELKFRFGEYERNPLYAESTILDPRFKRRGFRSEASYQAAVKNLQSSLCTVTLPNTCIDDTGNRESETVSATEDLSFWADYDQQHKKIICPDNNSAAAIREFSKYLNEEYLERTKDPLMWWNERKHIYPRVYTLALKRLCILATSVPCERIFSAMGQILNDRRTCLKSNKVSKIIFLQRNM